MSLGGNTDNESGGSYLQRVADNFAPDVAINRLKIQALRNDLIDKNNQRSAMSHTVGGRDPNGLTPGMNYNPDAPPTGTYEAQDENGNWQTYPIGSGPIGSQADSTPSLFTPRKIADQPLQSPAMGKMPTTDDGVSLFSPNLRQAVALQTPAKPDMQSLFGDTTPAPLSLFNDTPSQSYDDKRDMYLRQAAPETFLANAAQQALYKPFLDALPADQRAIAAVNPAKAAERMFEIKNPATPADILELDQLKTRAANGDKAAQSMLDIKTGALEKQRIQMMQQQMNMENKRLGYERYAFQADPGTGQLLRIDKENGQAFTLDGKPYTGGLSSLLGDVAAPTSSGTPAATPAPAVAAPVTTGSAPSFSLGSRSTQPITPQTLQKPAQPPASAQTQNVAQMSEGAPVDQLLEGSLSPDVQARLAKLPLAYQGTIRAMLTGKEQPPSGGMALRSPQVRELINLAHTIDPSFDETAWKARSTMATELAKAEPSSIGGRIGAARKLINHSFDALGSASDLRNDGAAPWANAIGNYVDDNLRKANPVQSALADFGIANSGVAGEFGKLMTGAQGSVGEREEMVKKISQNNPIATNAAALGRIAHLMEGQVEPLADQINSVMGTNYPIEHFLGPREAAKLALIKTLAAKGKAGTLTEADVKKAYAALGAQPAQTETAVAVKPGGTYDWNHERGLYGR
jgi:hypothetical protein